MSLLAIHSLSFLLWQHHSCTKTLPPSPCPTTHSIQFLLHHTASTGPLSKTCSIAVTTPWLVGRLWFNQGNKALTQNQSSIPHRWKFFSNLFVMVLRPLITMGTIIILIIMIIYNNNNTIYNNIASISFIYRGQLFFLERKKIVCLFTVTLSVYLCDFVDFNQIQGTK